ncbi:hypothetical protein BBJ28_00006076 [Nothophytophthora sp. Chile5]|nr:hypothetical protein BBJ28_00006076 [Nothophytophthora sp. Chile5]
MHVLTGVVWCCLETLKVIVVGNGNVGKTSMTTRYAKGKYTGNYKKTIGVDFMEKTVELRDLGESINLMIWDTAGQEEFDALTSRYYKGEANLVFSFTVIYVFSSVDRDSFEDLPKWKRKVEEECGRICSVLVQNKIDLVDDAAMSREEIEDMADYLNMRLYRSCVQDNINVSEVFRYLCRKFLNNGAGDAGDETLNAVADISALSKPTGAGSSPDHRSKRELSDMSDFGSDRTSTAAPSPTVRAPAKKPFPPSPPAVIDREYATDSDEEAEQPDDRRRGSIDDVGGADAEGRGDASTQSRKERSSKRSSKAAKSPVNMEEGTRRALSGLDSDPDEDEQAEDNDGDDDDDGKTTASPLKLQPSKRRTNGKKTHPAPECVIS